MTFQPTTEQQDALAKFSTGESLAIQAGAGTGKTSTLKLLGDEAIKQRRRGQYIAFNKAIVEESKGKMPSNVKCNTAHSLAFAAVGRLYQHRFNSNRMRSADLARRLSLGHLKVTMQDGNVKTLSASFLAGLAMRSATRFCQSADPEPSPVHVPYVDGIDVPPGRHENNDKLAAYIVPAMQQVWADWQDVNGSLPYRFDAYLKQWQLSGPRIGSDFILFDEAQDANPVMVAIVAAQTHAQLIWVGDSQQQIYSFTGAVDALATVGAAQQSMLTQSFRFGPRIANVANRVLADLNAELRLTGAGDPKSDVAFLARPEAILTRTNAAAVRSVLEAQSEGRSVHLVGGGADVVKFAKAALELMQGFRTEHPDLACFDSWNEVRQYVDQDEQGGDLRLLVKLVEEFGVEVILAALDNMVAEGKADLVVSTAHKAKGREWNTVKLASDFPDTPQGEELRLLYVAVTRARLVLDISDVRYFGPREDAEPEMPEDEPEDQRAVQARISLRSAVIASERGDFDRAHEAATDAQRLLAALAKES